jgi:hypothetical protein
MRALPQDVHVAARWEILAYPLDQQFEGRGRDKYHDSFGWPVVQSAASTEPVSVQQLSSGS